MRNYEAWGADSKECVPDKYYIATKTLVKGTPEHQLAHEVKETCQSKNKLRIRGNIITNVVNIGKLTLLNRSRTRTSKNPRSAPEQTQ